LDFEEVVAFLEVGLSEIDIEYDLVVTHTCVILRTDIFTANFGRGILSNVNRNVDKEIHEIHDWMREGF